MVVLQSDVSDFAEGAKSSVAAKDSSKVADANIQQVTKTSENSQASPVSVSSSVILPSPAMEIRVSSEVGISDQAENLSVSAASSSQIVSEEKSQVEDVSVTTERVYSDISTSLTHVGVESKSINLDNEYSQYSTVEEPCEKTVLSTELSQDYNKAKVHPVSATNESSELDPVVLAKQEAVEAESSEKENALKQRDEKLQFDASNEADDSLLEDSSKVEKSDLSEFDSVSDCTIPSANGELSARDANTNESEKEKSLNSGSMELNIKTQEIIPSPDPAKPERSQKLDAVSTVLSPKEKPILETAKAKPTATKKKKRKEILSKADAAGTPDLYNAYKGPEEKHESAITSESINSSLASVPSQTSSDDNEKEVTVTEEDGQGKAEIDDWEDAAESTPKLRASEHGKPINGVKNQPDDEGNEATSRKKYSRDFLLTFSQQYTDLPVGFEIGSDIADVLMNVQAGKSYIVNREPYPSPGRITDRPTSRGDHRMISNIDDDKWTKFPGPFSPNRDVRLDMGHGPSVVSFRPGQGVSHGVLRNPRGQPPTQFVGGILSGPMQSVIAQGGMQRSNSDADRWQRATSRGLIPSPQTPLQVMHKAERKYEVGKISDEEQAKQRQLKGILNKLTPQNFEKLFLQVKEVNIDNVATLTGVISQIFDKALMEPTFCEMYANFCLHLASALPDFSEANEKVTFKRLLLNKCQEEFERGEREQAEANKVEEEGEIKQSNEEREEKRLRARRRMLGNIRLIGELYKKKMLTERIMHECIKKLLGQYQNPDEEDVEALCKLMSTIGEIIDHPKAKEHMDAYFDIMLKMSTNQKLSSRVRFMLKDAIDLRKNKWQQRRKVEGPKKIEEVHRDAAQERQAQASRLARGGPVISSVPRRGAPSDYGPRGSSALGSSGLQQANIRGLPSQSRAYATQDVRFEDRQHQYESRTLSLPLPQRAINDDSLTLGPQGGLARGMSIRGQPTISNATSTGFGDNRRMGAGPNGYSSVTDWTSNNLRDDTGSRYMADRLPSPQDRNAPGSRDLRSADRAFDGPPATSQPAGRGHASSSSSLDVRSETKTFSKEVLEEKTISAIREFYRLVLIYITYMTYIYYACKIHKVFFLLCGI